MSLSISWSDLKLCTYKGDTTKEWFVYFELRNDLTGEVLRKQFRGGINYFHSKEERTREGKALRAYWKKKLERGAYNPWAKEIQRNPISTPKTLKDALKQVLTLKQTSLKKKSLRGYRNIHDMFLAWLERFGYEKLRLYQFQAKHAQGYLDFLILEKGYGGKTHNTHHGILHALFALMAVDSRKWIEKNPFAGIKQLPEDSGKNIPYDEDEKRLIIDHLKLVDARMYYAVCFVYHCFIRKTELTTIRVGDIDWESRTIRINSDAAKNRIQDCVTITEGLYPILIEMGLDRAPRHHYIFGKKMETCADRMTRPDDISDRYLDRKKELGYIAGDGKDFYSWKHTGVIAYYKLLKDAYAIMRQCRHGELMTTMIYLRSLGLNPNAPFLSAVAVL